MSDECAARSTLFAVSIGAAALLACGWGAECPYSCPGSSGFVVIVPADRANDVASVTSTGPCSSYSVSGSAPGLYFFGVTDDGVCQVTVSFRSGAPNFVGSVNIAPNAGPCCVGQATVQGDESIAVPELGPKDASSGN
jgi:hypothetical protein